MALRPDFITSDSHYGHVNIVKYCDRPQDHEAMMIKRWRHTVKDSHTILHLGDLFFGGNGGYERFKEEIAPRLTGQKYLILGNHDKRNVDYEALGFTVVKPYSILYQRYTVSFDHYPRLIHDNERRVHLHGHIHNHNYGQGEATRPNNVNCSVEVTSYTPQRFTRLANAAIRARKNRAPYYNSKSFRAAKINEQRRAA